MSKPHTHVTETHPAKEKPHITGLTEQRKLASLPALWSLQGVKNALIYVSNQLTAWNKKGKLSLNMLIKLQQQDWFTCASLCKAGVVATLYRRSQLRQLPHCSPCTTARPVGMQGAVTLDISNRGKSIALQTYKWMFSKLVNVTKMIVSLVIIWAVLVKLFFWFFYWSSHKPISWHLKETYDTMTQFGKSGVTEHFSSFEVGFF